MRPCVATGLLQGPLCVVVAGLVSFGPFAAESTVARACTTAVVSGKGTADGRPLLWKNRDAPHRDNEVVYIDSEPYRCVAVTNAGVTKSVWMGMNAAGFCIENSLSRDLTEKGVKGEGNGVLMLRALRTCATVDDFERLLRKTNEAGRATNANYGVIDATGGAAMFETAATHFTRFDANDPEVAPDGYVVRANFAFAAQKLPSSAGHDELGDLYSAERYVRGCRLIDKGVTSGELTPRYVLRHCCRDLAMSEYLPVAGSVNSTSATLPAVVNTESTISRAKTVSAVVFQGVKPGEDPLLSTMWVLLGDPAFTVAVPCWVSAERVSPELDGPEASELCTAALSLRDSQYVDKSRVRTDSLPEIWSAAWRTEDEIIDEAEREIAKWRSDRPAPDEVAELHDRLTRRAYLTVYELTKTVESVAPVEAPIPALAAGTP